MFNIFISHNRLILVEHQIALYLGRTSLDIRCHQLGCECLRRSRVRLRIKLEEHVLCLVLGGVANVLLEVDTPWANQGGIETVKIVCGHEDYATIGFGYTVEGVQ